MQGRRRSGEAWASSLLRQGASTDAQDLNHQPILKLNSWGEDVDHLGGERDFLTPAAPQSEDTRVPQKCCPDWPQAS